MMVNDEQTQEFVITFRRPVSNQEANQEANQVTNQESNQVANQVANQETSAKRLIKKDLTGQQKDIINYCTIPRTAQEIMDHIGVVNQSARRKQHLQPLIEAGFIERTNPESPTARNQKYRKVRK